MPKRVFVLGQLRPGGQGALRRGEQPRPAQGQGGDLHGALSASQIPGGPSHVQLASPAEDIDIQQRRLSPVQGQEPIGVLGGNAQSRGVF